MTTPALPIETLLADEPELTARLKRLAQHEGYGRNWQTYAAKIILKAVRALTGNDDLSPADVARILGLSKKTVLRDLSAGRFPNAWWKNSRVVFIPRKDVEAMRGNPVQASKN